MREYSFVFRILRLYWKAYGGIGALARSPYLHAAILVNAMMYRVWPNPGWWDNSIGVLASLVGFTLGGYAILIAFGDEDFKSLLTGSPCANDSNPFIVISATFMHFILVQIIALVCALIASGQPLAPILSISRLYGPTPPWLECFVIVLGYMGWFIGHGLFVYAVFLAISATVGIFRVSTWYDRLKNQSSREK